MAYDDFWNSDDTPAVSFGFDPTTDLQALQNKYFAEANQEPDPMSRAGMLSSLVSTFGSINAAKQAQEDNFRTEDLKKAQEQETNAKSARENMLSDEHVQNQDRLEEMNTTISDATRRINNGIAAGTQDADGNDIGSLTKEEAHKIVTQASLDNASTLGADPAAKQMVADALLNIWGPKGNDKTDIKLAQLQGQTNTPLDADATEEQKKAWAVGQEMSKGKTQTKDQADLSKASDAMTSALAGISITNAKAIASNDQLNEDTPMAAVRPYSTDSTSPAAVKAWTMFDRALQLLDDKGAVTDDQKLQLAAAGIKTFNGEETKDGTSIKASTFPGLASVDWKTFEQGIPQNLVDQQARESSVKKIINDITTQARNKNRLVVEESPPE